MADDEKDVLDGEHQWNDESQGPSITRKILGGIVAGLGGIEDPKREAAGGDK